MCRLKSLVIDVICCVVLLTSSSASQAIESFTDQTPIKCDFENNRCPSFWNLSAIPKPLRFQLNDPNNDRSSIGFDHTNKSRLGHFIFIRHQENDVQTQKQGLVQVAINQTESACFSFWFFMVTSSLTGQVNVTINGTVVTSKFGSYGNQWWHQQVEVFLFDVVNIQAVVTLGVVAIDDILIKSGPCPLPDDNSTFECDFEKNNRRCDFMGIDWQHEEDPDEYAVDPSWRVYQAKDSSIKSMVDHTFLSAKGHFYAIDFGKNNFTSKPVAAFTKNFPVVQQACVTFWYFIWKQTPQSFLNVYYTIADTGSMLSVFNVNGDQGPAWIGHRFQVYPDEQWKLTIEARGQGKGIVGIDDIEIKLHEECPLFARCDFESQACLWSTIKYKVKQQNLTDFLNPRMSWAVKTPNGKEKLFPNIDATTKTSLGSYLMVTNSLSDQTSDYALYESPRFDAKRVKNAKGACLSFSYVIFNNKSAILKVHQMEENLPFGDPQLIQALGSTNNKWQRVFININLLYSQSKTLWFYLQGFPILLMTKKSPKSFVAIDDIAFDYHPCPSDSNFSCADKQSNISSTQVCDFVKDCSDGSDELKCGDCTFDTDACGYSLSSSDSPFSWKRITELPGAKNSKGFMYSERNMTAWNTKNTADLKTPKIARSYAGCGLSFYYSYNGKIKFKVILLWKDQEEVELWDRNYYKNFTGDFGDWKQVKINLERIRVPFRIIFRSIFDELNGFMGEYNTVDEISFVNCQPPPTVSNSSCSQDKQKFACRTTGVCINASQVCDFQDDCGDGTDEDDCDAFRNRNDFENGFGMLDQVNWTLQNGLTKSSVMGPTRDHTKGLKSGTFIYLAAENQSLSNANLYPVKTAVWNSPFFTKPVAGSCTLRFFYQMEGQGNLNLEIGLHFRNNSIKWVGKLTGPRSEHSFSRMSVASTSGGDDFQFVVTASVQNIPDAEVYSYVAIDDISYSKECLETKTTTTASASPTTPTKPNLSSIFTTNVTTRVSRSTQITANVTSASTSTQKTDLSSVTQTVTTISQRTTSSIGTIETTRTEATSTFITTNELTSSSPRTSPTRETPSSLPFPKTTQAATYKPDHELETHSDVTLILAIVIPVVVLALVGIGFLLFVLFYLKKPILTRQPTVVVQSNPIYNPQAGFKDVPLN